MSNSAATNSSRVWFITGSSTGFGRILTELALEKGERVVATLRKPEVLSELSKTYPKSRLLVLKLDVTKKADVVATFEEARKHFGRIDVVFSNAGWGIVGEVESTTEQNARDQFEVNFWGASYVALEAMKQFREFNKPTGGVLLHMSSMFGIAVSPAAVWYAATKHAGDALIAGLASELDPAWNIKVSILCPGWFKTPMVTVNPIVEETHPAYTSNPNLPATLVRGAFGPMMTGESPLLGDPDKLIKQIFEVSKLDTLPLHVPFGKDALGCFQLQVKSYTETLEKQSKWSEDLTFN